MLGGIIIAVVLVIVFPVAVLISMSLLASALSMSTNHTYNADHAGTELLDVATTDYWSDQRA